MNINSATIIGAGPSGLFLAKELSKVLNVTVFEEDRMLGVPPHCTGLVNSDSLKALGISPPIIGTYRYVRIVDLEGHGITFDFGRDAIVMVDRPGLEHYLADEAGSVSFILGERVLGVGGGLVRTRSRNNKYEVAVIAEGASATLSRSVLPWEPSYVYGVQTDTKARSTNDLMPRVNDEIVVIFDRRLSNHFFAWIVPKDTGEFRVGIADNSNTWTKFMELLKIINAGHYKPFGGKIIIGGSPNHVVEGDVAIIGDAAGFVKPMTGGGIIMGMLSAKLLSDSLYMAMKEGLSVTDALLIYDNAYRRFVRDKVKALGAASYLLHMMINKSLSEITNVVNGLNIKVYDFDNHIEALMRMASRRPSVFIKAIMFVMNELSFMEIGSIRRLMRSLI
jgi:flavin-dependent dehydrogenase